MKFVVVQIKDINGDPGSFVALPHDPVKDVYSLDEMRDLGATSAEVAANIQAFIDAL